MTRRTWTVVIVVVAVVVAAAAGTIPVMAAHHGRESLWPQARLSAQNGQAGVQDDQSGRGWQDGTPGQNGVGPGQNGSGNGQNGGGFGWGDGSGPRLGGGAMRPGDTMIGRGAWQPLRGLPWLVLGLLVGAGATILVWQPWKRPALAAGAEGAAGAQGSADQWAQWHRGLHAADEAATQPIATEAAEGPEAAEVTAEIAAGAEMAGDAKTPAEPDSET